ncbi:unnamed protein product [Ectocarpus sp. 6 AP-2014]
MLKAHKRKTRRISSGGGSARSTSPRPSFGAEPGRRSAAPERPKSKTAPTSPLDVPAQTIQQQQQGLETAPPPKQGPGREGKPCSEHTLASGCSGGGVGVPGTAAAAAARRDGNDDSSRHKRGSGEPNMASVFTEWFQKLFAPNDEGKGKGGGSAGTPAAAAAGRAAGRAAGASGAASAAGKDGNEKGASDGDDVRSNITSVATSDGARPSSPSSGQASSAAAAAVAQRHLGAAAGTAPAETEGKQQHISSSNDGDAARPGAQSPAPTEESAPATSIAGQSADGAAAAASAAAAGGEQQQQQQPALSPRFLGMFSRGSSSGSAGSSSGKGKEDGGGGGGKAGSSAGTSSTPPAAGTAAAAAAAAASTGAGGAPAAGGAVVDVAPPGPDAGGVAVKPPAAPEEAPSFGGGEGPVQQPRQPLTDRSSAAEGAGLGAQAAGAAAAGAEGAAAAGAGREQAKATAPLRRDGSGGSGSGGGGGGRGSASRSTSPSRTAALSVGSDDGEEENLYTAGTHQGARPSIDDFSSLRVLGKGSYGKVVLVRRKNTGVLYAMKILKKGDVVRKRQVERTKIERRVLGNVEHPFLMRLHYAFQTDNKLYLVLDYCPGGELFFHLSRYKRFPEGVVRFYAAELVLALKHLHDNNIIYRDIKPENILLDADGHIKLGDFGLAKDNVSDSTFGAQSVCGTPEYMAPEVINKAGHGTAVDWWGLGMLMYEMLTGLPPWYTKDRQKLFERLRGAPLVIPKNVSAPSAGIIGGLLTRNPSKRLGTLGALQVMNHDFFRGLDWAALLAKRIPAPLNPCRNQRQGSESTHNFDPQFTRMPIDTMALGGGIVSPGPDGHFDGFTYEVPGVILEGDR